MNAPDLIQQELAAALLWHRRCFFIRHENTIAD
jgi:hypothetical protein